MNYLKSLYEWPITGHYKANITNATAILIDNIYTNAMVGNRIYSGILQTDISDQLPVFM